MSNNINVKNEILAGLTVALALVPEAIGFAFIAKVEPLVGLYAAVFLGLFTSLIGGRPGMISGATGPLAVMVIDLVANHGVEYLFASVIVMGIIQIFAGVLKLGKFVRMIPYPVIVGFLNGLAFVIFRAQFPQFKVNDLWMTGSQLYIMIALVFLTMAIIKWFPKLTKAVPASLVAIIVPTIVVMVFRLDTKTVVDMAPISGSLPMPKIPDIPFNLESIGIVLSYGFMLAVAGLINSLMTMTVLDEMTNTRGQANRVALSQGLANIITGLFGGMGGCSMMGQSIINVNSGGRRNISGIVAGLFLLSFILFASPIIENIPLAALVGVMFMVVIGTFKWVSLSFYGKLPKSDVIIILLVAIIMVKKNLVYAVIAGVVISALKFAWEKGKTISSKNLTDENGSKIYFLDGPLFFGSILSFKDIFSIQEDPDDVIIDFEKSRVFDHSAIEAINSITEKYKQAGKIIHLRHLSHDCLELLNNAKEIIEVNIKEDPTYHVADDMLAN